MSKVYKTNAVFVPGGMPQFTYVQRGDKNIEEVLEDAKENFFKLLTVAGPTKSGKTVLAQRIFPRDTCIWIDGGSILNEEDFWASILEIIDAFTEVSNSEQLGTKASFGGRVKGEANAIFIKGEGQVSTNLEKQNSSGGVKGRTIPSRIAVLSELRKKKAPLIVDDFHYLEKNLQSSIVRALKSLIFDGMTVALIVIPNRRYDAIKIEKELTGRVQTLLIPPWDLKELLSIPLEGLPLLNIAPNEKHCLRLAAQAEGSPHLMQEFCRAWVRENDIKETVKGQFTLNRPEDEIFYGVARDAGTVIFKKLAQGPVANSGRILRSLNDGRAIDIYELLMEVISNLSLAKESLSYVNIRREIKASLTEKIPRKNEIVRVLKYLSQIAISEDSSVPVVDWDAEEEKLYITDPFFSLYLHWGIRKENRVIDTKYYTQDFPLGPITTETLEEPSDLKKFIETDFKFYSGREQTPSFIVGRRGAGKTALLKSVYLNKKYKIITEIRTHNVFSYVTKEIDEIAKGTSFVENISELWETLFWGVLFSEIIKLNSNIDQDYKILNEYLATLGIDKDMKTDQVILKMFYVFNNRPSSWFNQFRNEVSNKISFSRARASAQAFLKKNNIQAVILMDSVEEIPLEIKSLSRTLSGLLKCIGNFNYKDSAVEVRFCIPTELWDVFQNLSSNPLKDFQKVVEISWQPYELLIVAAKRLSTYLKINDQKAFNLLKIESLNLNSRNDVNSFFKMIFPDSIVNKKGVGEKPVPYILRHTQLLPRQFLTFLNSIIKTNEDLGGNPSDISGIAVIRGIERVSLVVAKEIFTAYRYLYPYCEETCESCIPMLPLTFTQGEFHQKFNRFGKRSFRGGDFHDFTKMLIAIGCLGVVNRKTDTYIIGSFQYNFSGQLTPKADNEFCIHPLFSEMYGGLAYGNVKDAIYPLGTDEGLGVTLGWS